MEKIRARVLSKEKVRPPKAIHAMPFTGAGHRFEKATNLLNCFKKNSKILRPLNSPK
jgi:hypothetical protein